MESGSILVKPVYTDLNLSPTLKKDPITDEEHYVDSIIKNLDAIIQSVLILLKTIPGDVPFVPTLGLNMLDQIGRQMDYFAEQYVRTRITEALKQDPRISSIVRVSKVEAMPREHKYKITWVMNLLDFTDQEVVRVSYLEV